jgi:large subunit ribosomal protein L22
MAKGRTQSPTGDVYRASHRIARISARKARLVMDLVRGQTVETALRRLRFCEQRAAPMVLKVLESAVANASQEGGLDPAGLGVHRAFADDGPIVKRWRPRSMGRAFPRFKRTCHLSIEVGPAVAERRSKDAREAVES